MIKFNFNNYLEDFKILFSFLENDYGYKVIFEKTTDFNFIIEFERGGVRIHFNYDIRDNFFYFYFIRGEKTVFPNDNDNINIIPLIKIFKNYNNDLDIKKLQPDNEQYYNSLELNAKLLRNIVSKITTNFT